MLSRADQYGTLQHARSTERACNTALARPRTGQQRELATLYLHVLAQENKDEGWEVLSELTLPLRDDPIWRKKDAHHYFLKKLNDPSANCFKSIIAGTAPENGYAFNYDELAVEVTREAGEDSNGHKYFILSSGADTPRPIHLKKSNKTDLWYINAYSSIYVDVQPSIDLDAERFE